jgi:alkyl sulfatase BDS1-like metallo-beta-lactamase superfamily hydrolase
LVSQETAKAALDLYYAHRPKKPVVAVIYTHSHVDHFGGVRGVVSEDDLKAGKVRIIAPEGFTEEAVSENVMAGNAMSRRASYMYGNVADKGPQGTIGTGLGTSTSSGTVTLLKPTDIVTKSGQKLDVDGHSYEFLLVPGTEAPSEFHFYISDLKALCTAENATHTLHNLYTLRGAKTRDANKWVQGLNATLALWGDKAEVLFAPHHWPVWGNANVVDHIEKYRDTIKYIHDQALHLANQGYTMTEIGDMIHLPPSLQQNWSSHGYYGSVSHDARAVYNYYLGFFSGDPADLNPLPPAEAAKKYVDFMGGAAAVIAKARQSYADGDYRWVAQVMKQVVFADPANQEARNLEADAFEQLGYQAESGPWRNFYLGGAKELRLGVQKMATPNTASPDVIRAMSTDQFLDMLAIRLNGPRAADKEYHITLALPDEKKTYYLTVKNGVLNYSPRPGKAAADCTLTVNRADMNPIMLGQAKLADLLKSGKATLQGDQGKLKEFLGLLDPFEFWFGIVTPNPPGNYGQALSGDPMSSDNLQSQPPVSGD